MWLHLTQLDPALYQHALANPEHFNALVYGGEEGEPVELGPLTAVDEEKDVFGTDYRMIAEILEEQYGEHFEDEEEAQRDPLYRVTEGDEELEDIEFNYGPAFVFSPATVAALAEELAQFAAGDFGDLSELAAFFARAAKLGRHVIGGVD